MSGGIVREPIPVSNLRIHPFTTFHPNGVILVAGTSAIPEESNPMTVSWGTFGIAWEKPVVQVFVRPSRYTHDLIMKAKDFTLNWMPANMPHVMDICGQISGRHDDKWQAAGIHVHRGRAAMSGVVEESILAVECRILHRQDLDPKCFAVDDLKPFYEHLDYHTLIIGEVIAAAGTDQFKCHC